MTTGLEKALKETFGFDQFREGQQKVIKNVLDGQSSLAIFPTGSGKSLCYQLSATQLPNLTLVVSPLLALIKDQLAFLHKHNIPAASLDSTLNFEEYKQVVSDIRQGRLKILMVSVERFKNERFRMLMEGIPVSLLVVDEAHCISEWGHNFRPDYLKLPSYQKDLGIPQALLLTATATRKVKMDMAKKFNILESAISQTGFYRSNLDLNVLAIEENDKLEYLNQLIRRQGDVSGIVYVTLQNTAESVADYLSSNGVQARAYHAGLEGELRKSVQDNFMAGDLAVVVATIAFGMGVDKSNIRYVVHFDLPKSIENYSQEIGRAGRDGKASQCFVLANLDGLNTLENFVYGDTPEQHGIEVLLENIRENSLSGEWKCSLYSLSNATNIRQLTLKTLLVKLEMINAISPRYSFFESYKVKLLTDQEHIISQFHDERRSFVVALFDAIAFKKIWGLVDFDSLYEKYGGERKRAVQALEYLRDQGCIELQTSGSSDVFSVNEEVIRRPGLAELLSEQFKQHETSEIKRIEFMLRYLQSNVCLSYGLAKYFDDQNAPETCGHCSVCRGKPAKLVQATMSPIPHEFMRQVANDLRLLLKEQGSEYYSEELAARFLAGIASPVFTPTKARKKVRGFASAEKMHYSDILKAVSEQPDV